MAQAGILEDEQYERMNRTLPLYRYLRRTSCDPTSAVDDPSHAFSLVPFLRTMNSVRNSNGTRPLERVLYSGMNVKVYSNWSRDAEAVDDMMMSSGIGKVVDVMVDVVVDVVEGEVGMTLRCCGMGVKLVVNTGAT